MPDNIDTLSVLSEGGLNSSQNHVKLSDSFPGQAVRLLNFEPSLYGGYRRLSGYMPYDTDYPEVGVGNAEGPVLGLAIFNDSFQSIILSARKEVGENAYYFYRYVFGAGWVKQATAPARVMVDGFFTVKRVRHEDFDFGDGPKVVFVDGVNLPVVFDGLDWFELNPSNTGADEDNAGGNQLLEKPALVQVFKNHVFFSGDDSYKTILCHSAPNKWFDYTSANGGGQILTGSPVVQIKPFRDSLYVFGRNNINKAVADVTAGFLLEPVTTNVGCIARDSVVEIGGDLAFLSPDGVRPVAGTSNIGDVELETTSRTVQKLMSDLPLNYDMTELQSVTIRGKSQLRYFISSLDTPQELSFGIVGAIRVTERDTAWEFSEIMGIKANVATSDYVNNEEYVLHGGYDGVVYRQEVGITFNGSPIISMYKTPYYDMGEPTTRKLLRKMYVFLRSEGEVRVPMSVSFDWGNSTTLRPSSYILESSGPPVLYGREVQYGDGSKYGGSEQPIMLQTLEGSGMSAQFTFVTTEIMPSFSIQGFSLDYTLQGKR